MTLAGPGWRKVTVKAARGGLTGVSTLLNSRQLGRPSFRSTATEEARVQARPTGGAGSGDRT
jgi:hypothetical protein